MAIERKPVQPKGGVKDTNSAKEAAHPRKDGHVQAEHPKPNTANPKGKRNV